MQINRLLPLFLLILLISCGPAKKEQPLGTAADPKAEITRLTKEIEDDESNDALYEKRAKLYMGEKQFDAALKDMNKAISLAPKKVTYQVTLSDIYLLMGKPKNSSDALLAALKQEPENNIVILRLAKLNLIIREYKTAGEYVKKSLELVPGNNPEAYFTKALILLETGDTVSAVTDLKKTVSMDQTNFEALVELGQLYSLRKDPIAADYLDQALRLRPGNKEALYILGMFYQESGQYDKAIVTYQRLEKVDSTFRNASYNQGYIYLVYLHDFPKAIEQFSIAITKDPLYTDAWFNRGYAYELSGDFVNARKNYKRSLEITTNYPKAIEALNRLDKQGR